MLMGGGGWAAAVAVGGGGCCRFKTCPDYQTNTNIEDIYQRWDSVVSPEEIVTYEPLIRRMVAANVRTAKELNRCGLRTVMCARVRVACERRTCVVSLWLIRF